MTTNQQYLFADEPPAQHQTNPDLPGWKVLIVDDEKEVHAVTRLSLMDVSFEQRGLAFLSAYSRAEAQQLVSEHHDIALILLDVVMDTDDAGLKVTEFVRNTVKNQFVRIVLRTGQPGQAPERAVVMHYDINDYKAKTELTSQKLFTVVMSALRSYRDIMRVEQQRQQLEQQLEQVLQQLHDDYPAAYQQVTAGLSEEP